MKKVLALICTATLAACGGGGGGGAGRTDCQPGSRHRLIRSFSTGVHQKRAANDRFAGSG